LALEENPHEFGLPEAISPTIDEYFVTKCYFWVLSGLSRNGKDNKRDGHNRRVIKQKNIGH